MIFPFFGLLIRPPQNEEEENILQNRELLSIVHEESEDPEISIEKL